MEPHGQHQASGGEHSHGFPGMGWHHLPTSALEFLTEKTFAAQLGQQAPILLPMEGQPDHLPVSLHRKG